MPKEQPTELELEQLEAVRLQNELARMQLNTLRQEVETKQNNKKRGAADAMKANADRKAEQSRCNHHMGGDGAMAIIYGQGDMDRPTAISGIQFTDESIMLRCNRCGKKWHSSHPQGNEEYGVWRQGAELFRKSQFKTIAAVGGVITKKKIAVA